MTDTTGSGAAAGWYGDPYGRFQQRYFDGTGWTEHVVADGQQQVDPMGASPVIPLIPQASAVASITDSPSGDPTGGTGWGAQGFAGVNAPGTAGGAAGGGGGRVVTSTLDSMAPLSRRRARPSLLSALAGIGGVVIAFGLGSLVFGDEGGRGLAIGAGVLITAAAVALRWFVKKPEGVQAASIGMLIVGLLVLSGGITSGDSDFSGWTFLLAGALHIGAWLIRPFKGRTVLLGLGLTALLFAFGSLSSLGGDDEPTFDQDQVDECLELEFEDPEEFEDEDCDEVLDEFFEAEFSSDDEGTFGFVDNQVGTTGWLYLVGALVLLGGTWWLDRKGYHGTATATVAPGILGATVGTVLAIDSFDGSGKGTALLVTVAGCAIGIVGHLGKRRATSWWGAALAAGGTVALIFLLTTPSSTRGIGGVAILSGLVLIGVPAIVKAIRDNQRNEGAGPSPTAGPGVGSSNVPFPPPTV
jgi:hypothetical protein